MKVATICYCLHDDDVLLGMKKVRFGAGKWNGFGGGAEEGESIEQTAARELEEESGLRAMSESLKKVAVISFYFGEKPMFECHVFLAREWEGEPHESEEMKPQWFPVAGLPYKDMWPSDLYWLPAVLQGHTLTAVCHFDSEGKIVDQFEMTQGVVP